MRHHNPDRDYFDAPDPAPRRRVWLHRCACGPDLPGTCPGPAACPYSGMDDEQLADADQLEEA